MSLKNLSAISPIEAKFLGLCTLALSLTVSLSGCGSLAAPATIDPAALALQTPNADGTLTLVDYREATRFMDDGSENDLTDKEVIDSVFGTSDADRDIEVNGSEDGAFTEPNKKQTVYLVQNHDDAGAGSSTRLAVFEGRRPVANVRVEPSARSTEYDFLLLAVDVDGDGVRELLLETSKIANDVNTSADRLVSLKGGKAVMIKDFGVVEEDTCESGDPKSKVKQAVITYTPTAGKIPDFKLQTFTKECSAEAAEGEKDSRDARDEKGGN